MGTFGNMMKYYRERCDMSQAEMARRLGLSRTAVSMYESGQREPDFATEERIADMLGVDLNSLRGFKSQIPGYTRINVYGYISAGRPIEMVECVVDQEDIPAAMAMSGEYFGLRIKGHSMEQSIMDGDTVIVRKQQDVDSGDVAIVAVNGEEATCKVVKKTGNGVWLIPKNPEYEPLFFTSDEVSGKPVSIIGKVVELRRKL